MLQPAGQISAHTKLHGVKLLYARYKWSRTTGIAPLPRISPEYAAWKAGAQAQGGVAESVGIEPTTNRCTIDRSTSELTFGCGEGYGTRTHDMPTGIGYSTAELILSESV
jgi:hypothetical protein